MQYESWSAFFSMGGRAWFVWGSYLLCFFIFFVEPILVYRRFRKAREALRHKFILEEAEN